MGKTSQGDQVAVAVETGPIMLALSAFRRSDALVDSALDMARREQRPLFVAYVIDQNVDRYLYSDVVSAEHMELLEKNKTRFIAECEKTAKEAVAAIEERAAEAGLEVESVVLKGRYGIEIARLVAEKRPAKVTLTR